MAGATTELETSWLRVEGPQDAQTCAWCRRWAGRVLPMEMKATYLKYHEEAAPERACRCTLEREQIALDREDPGCLWA